jgi:WD40 repeat protein
MDLKFSPNANVIAVAQVTGHVRVYSYNDKETTEQLTFDFHSESCRTLDFSPDGEIIYTGSADKSFGVITNGKMQGQIKDAHPSPVHVVKHLEDNNMIATGDDDGMIRIWDLRMAQQGKKHAICMEFTDHEGTILSMDYKKNLNQLVTASTDGMLGVFDLRKKELYAMSDNF